MLGTNPDSGQEVLLKVGATTPYVQSGRETDGYGGEPRRVFIPEVRLL